MTPRVGNQVTSNLSLTEGAFLKLTFQLFFSTVFFCSTHSIEMHGKERHTESTDVLKFCQYALIIQSKFCVDLGCPFHSQDFIIGILLSAIQFSFFSSDS